MNSKLLEQKTKKHEIQILSCDGELNFCFILSTGTMIRIDSVMRLRSSSRGRNTSAAVTVTIQHTD